MPKLCLICGHRDDDGTESTCVCCGEGSWMPIEVESEPALEPMPVSEPKHRKGRR